jgi:hypothetical protein
MNPARQSGRPPPNLIDERQALAVLRAVLAKRHKLEAFSRAFSIAAVPARGAPAHQAR